MPVLKVFNKFHIWMNVRIWTSVLSMHLTASHINFVLIHMEAMSVNVNLVSIELEANALMSMNVRTRFILLLFVNKTMLPLKFWLATDHNLWFISDYVSNLGKGNPCPYRNEICHNTEGSFYCDCEEGYQEQGSSNKNRSFSIWGLRRIESCVFFFFIKTEVILVTLFFNIFNMQDSWSGSRIVNSFWLS